MFKNRHIELKFVKTPKAEEVAVREVNPEEISALAKDFTKYVALTAVAVIGSAVAIRTLGDIALVAAKEMIKS